MTQAVQLRPDLDLTLGGLAEELAEAHDGARTDDVSIDKVVFDLEADKPTISWAGGSAGKRELPATEEGCLAFGAHLKVPGAFLRRVPVDLRQAILSRLAEEARSDAVRITWSGEGVRRVTSPDLMSIPPLALVRAVIDALGTDEAPVVRLVDEPGRFAFDAVVPEGAQRGVRGIAPTLGVVAVSDMDSVELRGDLTAGGLRVDLDRARNLSPTVQPFAMRRRCTSGLEFHDPALKIDARIAKRSAEAVLAEFGALAERAYSRVEDLIVALYDLRDQKVDNPERVLNALASEQDGISDRSLRRLLDAAPALESPTMFDVVLLVANSANDPGTVNDGGRVGLERAAGSVVAEHARRCSQCQHKLGD